MNIAFLTAACMLEGHPQAREDRWEFDREFDPMSAACAARGMQLRPVVWDDPAVQPADHHAFVVGTTWDYTDKPQQFLQRLEQLAAVRPVFNDVSVLRWNLHKSYLRDLAARGIAVVPTLWRERADAPTIAAAFDQLGVDEIVVKPVVGASAWRQARLKRGEPLPSPDQLPPADTMLQPFLPAAAAEGEYSFLFFGGRYSHCARKSAVEGDYRVQSMFGGRERIHEPSAQELRLAQGVIDAVGQPLLYARVDMMRGLDGNLALMELELIEPYLYPDQGPGMGERFADSLATMLEANS